MILKHAWHSTPLDCSKKCVGRSKCRFRNLSTRVLDAMQKARKPEEVFAWDLKIRHGSMPQHASRVFKEICGSPFHQLIGGFNQRYLLHWISYDIIIPYGCNIHDRCLKPPINNSFFQAKELNFNQLSQGLRSQVHPAARKLSTPRARCLLNSFESLRHLT